MSLVRASIRALKYPRSPDLALKQLDLAVDAGEFVVLTGTAGAGKTSLCYCLTGVVPHSVTARFDGQVEIAGRRLSEMRLPEISTLVSFMLQVPENQLFALTVGEEVIFGPENLCLAPAEILRRRDWALESVDMQGYLQRMTDALSGGEAQRVVLAAILAMKTDVLVLDQPAAELDPVGRLDIYERIHHLNREEGKTILVVEHRLEEIAQMASRIVVLEGGQIVRDATPAAFFSDRRIFELGLKIPEGIQLYHYLAQRDSPPERVPLSWEEAGEVLGPRLEELGPLPAGEPQRASGPDRQGQPAVDIQGLSFRYPDGTEALRGVELRFWPGELAAIIGENGAGKTTLAKQVIGLLRPLAGRVLVQGRETGRLSVAQLSHHVGYLFQDPDYQIFSNSVWDEAAFSLKVRKRPPGEIQLRVEEVLKRLGLWEVRERHPYLISRGQRQRLALASILVHQPGVIIADEPSTGLDYRESLEIMDLLRDIAAQGTTVLIITHDMELVFRYAERSAVMANGRVELDVPTSELGDHFQTIRRAGIRLPGIFHLAEALGLSPGYARVSALSRLLAGERERMLAAMRRGSVERGSGDGRAQPPPLEGQGSGPRSASGEAAGLRGQARS